MKTAVLLAMAIVLAGAILATSALAFDRPPISVAGLTSDGWGQSVTGGERQLRGRYAGIRQVYCEGVILPRLTASQSSWVHGMTRYWDKLVCAGYTYTTGSTIFVLIYDAKSASGWIIYRLKNVTITALQTP